MEREGESQPSTLYIHPSDILIKIISPSDIAVYGTLCALATLNRGAINAQLLQSDTFSIYLEHEPYVRELLSAYMSSKFKIVLELLEKYSVSACPPLPIPYH